MLRVIYVIILILDGIGSLLTNSLSPLFAKHRQVIYKYLSLLYIQIYGENKILLFTVLVAFITVYMYVDLRVRQTIRRCVLNIFSFDC